jgi:hypothetical protein
MPPDPTPPNDRLHDLLADEALQGLSATEREELHRLLALRPEVEPTQLERAAAALQLGLCFGPLEPVPADLRARLEGNPVPARRVAVHRSSVWSTAFAWSGWAVAAACLVWAIVPAVLERSTNSPEADRAKIDRSGTTVTWQAPKGAPPLSVSGSVVWDSTRQSGYLRIEGLPPNDPRQAQYQLWIIDPSRDEHPIDGGVFDVPAEGAAVVSFRPAVRPVEPTAFAVTRERPGGVVVTRQPHLITAARGP